MSNACNPTPSSPADLYPESECENCSTTSGNECYCDMNDLTWDISVTECMASLDIIQGDTLYQVLAKIADKFCDLDCADIFMPGTYLNTGFVGTEKTCTYDITGAAFGSQCYVTINSVQYDLGVVANSADLVIALNAIGEGLWSYASNTMTVTGYYVFGNLLIDDAVFSSACTATGEYQTLCDYAGAVDDKFAGVDSDIATEISDRTLADASLQAQIDALTPLPSVLHNDVVDATTAGTGSYDDLKTYTLLQAATNPTVGLVNNGDMLIIEAEFTTDDASDNNIGKYARIVFDGNTLTYVFGFSTPSITVVKMRVKITRVSNTEVSVSSETEIYSTSFATYDMQAKAGYTNFSISGLDINATDYDIIAQGQNITTGANAVINKSLQIRIARI